MQLSDFHFDLPDSLIARYPMSERTASRLLVLNGATGGIQHQYFTDLPSLLNKGDLLIFNDTKVLPARLWGKKSTGGRLEILVEHQHHPHTNTNIHTHTGTHPQQHYQRNEHQHTAPPTPPSPTHTTLRPTMNTHV